MNSQEKLQELVPDYIFNLYFKIAVFTPDTVTFPNLYIVNKIQKKYMPELTEAFGGTPPTIQIEAPAPTDSSTAETPTEQQPPAEVVKFPAWPEHKRFAPNRFLRSAVFTARHGKRELSDFIEVFSQENYSIRYTGPTLEQSDLDVWMGAAQLARKTPIGAVCTVTAREFLLSLGRATGGTAHHWLRRTITRLQSAVVSIRLNGRWSNISLLKEAEGDYDTDKIKIIFDINVIQLFAVHDWTALLWEERKQLSGKPLALWLHGFYSSHAKPIPMKISALIKLSGSETKEPRYFKKALKRAFDQIKAIVPGFKARFEGEMVYVERKPTKSQAKHLMNKK